MGCADIIPGVSGGTMALILGIYQRLLEAIKSFDREWLRLLSKLAIREALRRNDLLFLLPLLTGILVAVMFFTKVIPLPRLIITHPEIIYGLFFGLIVASIVVLMMRVENFRPPDYFTICIGVGVGFVIVNLVPFETPEAAWFVFLSGMLAISAMLLPGISGSFILLILGKYAYIIDALGSFNVPVIAVFSLGCLSGVIIFSRVIVWLLGHYHKRTLLMIDGILIGSLWMIWPFQQRSYEIVHGKQRLVGAMPVWPDALTLQVGYAVMLMIVGFGAVMLIHLLATRRTGRAG